MSLIEELKRRNVFRVAIAYLTGAWLLVEVVETLFPIYGLSNASIRLVVTLLAIGFPLTLVLSWVYELTPEGLRLEKDVDRSAPRPHDTHKKLDRLIIVLLTLAVGYFAFDKFVLEPMRVEQIVETAAQIGAEHALDRQRATALPDNSIAVLPFANMSPDPADEYFSDGLTEELIGALARVNGLHVTARTSAFAFKDANLDVREIGRRLNVRTVLEGSVRREQDRVRISAQLIGVDDGFNLWSESYDYELESVLVLQETLSRAIVGALQMQLSPQAAEPQSPPASVHPEAYDLYLKGRYYWGKLNTGGFQKSIEMFRQAIAVAPEYAPPHAGLAIAYSFAGYFGLMPPREAFPLSKMTAAAALALDPESSDALLARGMAWLMYDWDRDRARDDLERALELSPNASLANWAYTEYLLVVEPAAALGSALRTLALDPLSLPIMNLVAFSYLERGMLDEAQRMDEEMLALDPTFNAAHWNRGVVHLLRGQFEAALGDLDRSVAYSGGMVPTLAIQALAHARSGDEAKALAILSELESRRELPERGYVSPVLIAAVYEGLGKTEEALSWLETGLEERDGWLIFLNAFPRFESLRAEARFEKVLQHVGLPASDHR